MKILVINWQCIKNPLGGGAEVHMHEIFKRIAARGHDVTIFCSLFEGAPEEEFIDGIKHFRAGGRSFFNYIAPKFYRKKFRKEKFDVVIDDINKVPFYTPLFVKEPLLAISHHFFGRSIFRQVGRLTGYYILAAEKLVDYVYKKTPFAVVSQSTWNEFEERGFDMSKFSIVPNAIEPKDFPMRVGEKLETPTIAYFGRLKKYKSVDHIVKAFAKVVRKVDSRLFLLGRGDFRPELERLAARLGVAERTKFFGFVSEEDKVKLLSRVWVVVNSSMKEGWGITNIEANACGTPVISADSQGLRDSVAAGKSGSLYDYGDVDELAEQLIELLTNEEKREKLSRGAVEWASEFSWDRSADLMLEKIEKTIREF